MAVLPAVVVLFISDGRYGLATQETYLDSGQVKIGIDLDRGGSITFLATSRGGESVVNVHDLGREIQQSYYSGPVPYGNPNPDWPNWPWNPIQAGDSYGHAATVLASSNDGHTLYVKTLPLQWALDNVPCECSMETWITLDGHAAHVRNRLTNSRSDLTRYGLFAQELPAVYTIGKLYRFFTYSGAAPYTGGPLDQVPLQWPPGSGNRETEHWVAIVDDQDWGLGVFTPETFEFTAGFFGPPDTGGPADDSTGYVAPYRTDILDHNIVYDYEYWLVLGPLTEIRAWVMRHRVPSLAPDFRFGLAGGRQHFWYNNATDDGPPANSGLAITATGEDPESFTPEQWWDAAAAPVIYVRGAFQTSSAQAQVFWKSPGQDYSEDRRVNFDIIGDGQVRTYAVHLAGNPLYTGTLNGLRFDPMDPGTAGDSVNLDFISFIESDSVLALAAAVPSSGPAAGGASIAIYGSGFASGAGVEVDGNEAGNVFAPDANHVSATVPALAPGTLNDVTVTNPGASGAMLPAGWFADFLDLPQDDIFHSAVETIFRNRITAGCGGGLYCRNNPVTRAQMAVFLLKGEHGSSYVPPDCMGIFPDVQCTPTPAFAVDWIEQLFTEGITGGCGGGNYCPGSSVTRAQMAVFLLKAEHGSAYVPPSCRGIFLDVECTPSPAFAVDWIEQLYKEGITGGCGATNYCPSSAVTRGQMSVFLTKTFGLQ